MFSAIILGILFSCKFDKMLIKTLDENSYKQTFTFINDNFPTVGHTIKDTHTFKKP